MMIRETKEKIVGKASCQNKRCGGSNSAKHNDRTNKMKHMDETKIDRDVSYMKLDGMWCPCFNGENELAQYELGVYKELFEEHVVAQKEFYTKNSQKKEAAKQSVEKLYEGKRTAPDEILLQVFDKGKYKDREKFEKMVLKQIEALENDNFRVISYSIHESETSLHAHVRGVWLAKDKFGHLVPKQDAALKEMGMELPKPNEPKSRHNNRKQTWTKMEQESWYNIVEEVDKSVKIDRTPTKTHKKAQIDHEKGLLERIKQECKEVLNKDDKTLLEAYKMFQREKGQQKEFQKFYEELFLERKVEEKLERVKPKEIEETIEDIELF